MKRNYRWLAILLSLLLLMTSLPGAALAGDAPDYDATAQMLTEELFLGHRESGVESISGIGGFDLGSIVGPYMAGISVGDWVCEGTSVSEEAYGLTAENPKELATQYMAQWLLDDADNQNLDGLSAQLEALFDVGYHEDGIQAGFFYPADLTDEDPWNDTPNHWGNLATFDRLAMSDWHSRASLTETELASIVEYLLSLRVDEGNQGFGGGFGPDYLLTAQAIRSLSVYGPLLGVADADLAAQAVTVSDAALTWMESESFLQSDGSLKGGSWDVPVVDSGEYLATLRQLGYTPEQVSTRVADQVTTPEGKSPLTFLNGLSSNDLGNMQQVEAALRGLLAAGAQIDADAVTVFALAAVGGVDLASLSVGGSVYLTATGYTLNGGEEDLSADSTYVVDPVGLGHVTKDLSAAWFVRDSLEGGSVQATSPSGFEDELSLTAVSAWVRVEAPGYTLQPKVEVDIPDGATYDQVLALWADQTGHVLAYDGFGMISQVDGIDSVGDAWGFGPSWMTVDWQASYHEGDILVFSGNSSGQSGELSLNKPEARTDEMVTATVLDALGAPVSVAEVIYYDEANRETPWTLGTTDASGQLIFSLPQQGSYLVASAKTATAEDMGLARTEAQNLLIGDAVYVRIESPNYTIEPGETVIVEPGADQVEVIDAWANAKEGRTYEAPGGFISSIQGESEDGLYWMVEPWQAEGYYDGDSLIFSGNTSTVSGEIAVSDASLYEGSSVTVSVSANDLPVVGAEVIYYTESTRETPQIVGVTDGDGELSVRLSERGTYYLAADKDNTAMWPDPDNGIIRTLPVEVVVSRRPAPSGISVSVEVNGQDGRIYRGSVTLSSGDKYGETPLGALNKTGLSYKASSGFVSRIEDESNQGTDGWMYKVNGKTPMVSADGYALDAGDDVEWYYSTDIEGFDGEISEEEAESFEEAQVELDGTSARIQLDDQGLIIRREQVAGSTQIVLVGEDYELVLPVDLYGDQEVLRILIQPASSGMEADLRDFFESQEGFYSNGFPLISFVFEIGDGEDFEALGYLSRPAELRFTGESGLGSPVGLRVTESQSGELTVQFVPYLDGQDLLVPARFSAYTVASYIKTNELSITIGEKGYTHNGEAKTMDVAPFIQDGRTMVPLRFLSESLGAWVGWDVDENRASVRLGDETVSVVIDEPIEGFDTEAVLIDGRTFVPLSYINDFFSVESIWFPAEKMVMMERPVME